VDEDRLGGKGRNKRGREEIEEEGGVGLGKKGRGGGGTPVG